MQEKYFLSKKVISKSKARDSRSKYSCIMIYLPDFNINNNITSLNKGVMKVCLQPLSYISKWM